MSRYIRILIVCVMLVFLSLCAAALLRIPPDPLFQGKRMSVWMKEFNFWSWPIQPQARVLLQSGGSAEPLLKRMLRPRDSSLKTRFLNILAKQSIIKFQIQPAAVSQKKALEVCNLLGPRVKGTVPEIEALVNDYPRKLKDPVIANFALNTLATMGPDGIEGLVLALTNVSPSIRFRAAELLGTAPSSGSPEIIAALTKCRAGDDISLENAASRSLKLIHERMDQHLPASSTNWLETAETPGMVPSNLFWDANGGTRIISVSGLDDGGGTLNAGMLFGGNHFNLPWGEDGAVIFQGSKPDGFTHFIEWQTSMPVTVRSIGLIARHDFANTGFARAFRSFRLYCRSDDSSPFKMVYQESVPIPYGHDLYSSMLYLFRNIETPVAARQFRAEFIQNGSGAWHGPRIVRLYGFGAPLNQPMVMEALNNQEPYVREEVARLYHR